MCLAIPAQVKELEENNMAEVDIMGVFAYPLEKVH